MKKILKILFLCIIDVLILSIGHASQSTAIVISALVGFVMLTILNSDEKLLPIMLFFLPWSTILKISTGSYTMFTLAIPFIFITFMIKNRAKKRLLDIENIILVILLTIITIVTKLCLGYSISGSYIQFWFMIAFIPLYLKVYADKIDFPTCIVFLSVGAILASSASQILMKYSHILSFIDIYEWENIGLTRLSGFYGDSNFYSVHFIVAIAGLLVMISKCKSKFKTLAEMLGVFALIYYGMMSVSKMFILCLMLIIIVWLFGFLIGKDSLLNKFVIMLGLVGILLFLFVSGIFTDQINYYLIRFSMVDNASSFTTGRLGLWIDYLSYIFQNTFALLFGIGLTNIRLSIFTNDTHNTVIQLLYQVGIVGMSIIAIWIKKLYHSVCVKSKLTLENHIYQIMILIGFFLPWMALDMLYYDEFFYIIALYLVFKKYCIKQRYNFQS